MITVKVQQVNECKLLGKHLQWNAVKCKEGTCHQERLR